MSVVWAHKERAVLFAVVALLAAITTNVADIFFADRIKELIEQFR